MPPKKRTNGYKMPKPLPNGEILLDINQKQWRLGPSIGKGGFGEIYTAQEATQKKNNQYPYVIKIEPHTNGPLFVEMHFLLRNAKKEDVENFMDKKKLKSLGMPFYIGSGSHEHDKEKFRFVVLEKFGSDIWKMFLENKKEFPLVTVLKIGAQILDVLEYIHSRGYVHHDIKGANILLDLKDNNQVYLVDYGLAGHYFTGKVFKPDPKKAHDGTLEYVSRDGHNGLQTRRGDLEILGYNLIQWLGCELPWETDKNTQSVQKSKEDYMNDIPDLMKACFKEKNPPKAIMEYFIYLTTLDFDSEPDYKKLQKILTNGISSNGGSVKSPLVFTGAKTPMKRKNMAETPSSGKKPRLPRRKLDVNKEDEGENDDISETAPNKLKRKNATDKSKKPRGTVEEDDEDKSIDEDADVVPNSPEQKNVAIKKGKKPKRTAKSKDVEDAEEITSNQKAKKTKKQINEDDEDNINDETKKPKKIEDPENGNQSTNLNQDEEEGNTNGYTAEMKRIQDRITATKPRARKPKIQPVQNCEPSTSQDAKVTRRNRKIINYREDSTED